MLDFERLLFLYNYSGGMPPVSLEELYIEKDRLVHYLIGNSWPKQPPFDEIGTYEWRLDEEVFSHFQAELTAICQKGKTNIIQKIHADSGVESFEAMLGNRHCEFEWNPSEPPEELLPVIDIVRTFISELREHPLSTLHVKVEDFHLSKNLKCLRFALLNKGKEPFIFYDFDYRNPETRVQVRVKCRNLNDASVGKSMTPIQLIGSDPVSIQKSGNLPVSSGGQITLTPQECIMIDVPMSTACSELDKRDRSYSLFALVRVCFQHKYMEKVSIEEGWLMPEPVKL